jgi:hypothetical protein
MTPVNRVRPSDGWDVGVDGFSLSFGLVAFFA